MRSSGEGGPAMVGAVVRDSGDGGWGQWWAAVVGEVLTITMGEKERKIFNKCNH